MVIIGPSTLFPPKAQAPEQAQAETFNPSEGIKSPVIRLTEQIINSPDSFEPNLFLFLF